MARARAKRGGEEPDVPVQSFSDIAFLLIIFFILATSLSQVTGIVTDIPAGRKAETKTEKTNIVNIHDGAITFNDAGVSIEGLRAKLKGLGLHAKKDENAKVIMLEATGAVSYQQYYSVMTSIAAAGGVVAIVQDTGEGETTGK